MRIDLKKDRKALYQPGAGDFSEAIVPETGYLAIDGRGDPNTAPRYADYEIGRASCRERV